MFVGQYMGVRSGNFLVITPLNGNLGAVAVTAANRPHQTSLKRQAQKRKFTLSDRL